MFGFSTCLLLLSFCVLISAQLCPPQEDIRPCMCLNREGLNHIHCDGISSLSELQKSIKRLQGTKAFTFTISDSDFEYLPYDIFKNMSIHHLSLSKSKLNRIGNLGDPQFEGLETSLESLTITESFTRKHPFAYVFMDHLKSLKTLEVRRNHVEVLHNEWFKKGLPDLRVIRFVQCVIRAVGWRALQSLRNLKVIDLSDNAINYIPRTAFPEPAPSLEEINLERNVLSSLPEDFFSNMPNLRIVNLELNEFSTIDQAIFGNVWSHLQILNIDFNPIVCDSKIKWIYEGKDNLEQKLVGLCFKPFTLFEREIHSLKIEELK
ncbi:protein artichoke-like [Argiope bruennichi]|uniref:Toll-like receptor 9 like protein n=1 Tax=Argiope bruennichi TaxID=94029 RepID=A0A8T0EUY4_ARGBR|nr:protein artichoke-like [Argiope bruennichi]KAF8781554.1 Toll-like receptor 9 like protein [Argiope bruennichi]